MKEQKINPTPDHEAERGNLGVLGYGDLVKGIDNLGLEKEVAEENIHNLLGATLLSLSVKGKLSEQEQGVVDHFKEIGNYLKDLKSAENLKIKPTVIDDASINRVKELLKSGTSDGDSLFRDIFYGTDSIHPFGWAQSGRPLLDRSNIACPQIGMMDRGSSFEMDYGAALDITDPCSFTITLGGFGDEHNVAVDISNPNKVTIAIGDETLELRDSNALVLGRNPLEGSESQGAVICKAIGLNDDALSRDALILAVAIDPENGKKRLLAIVTNRNGAKVTRDEDSFISSVPGFK